MWISTPKLVSSSSQQSTQESHTADNRGMDNINQAERGQWTDSPENGMLNEGSQMQMSTQCIIRFCTIPRVSQRQRVDKLLTATGQEYGE